MTTASPVRIKDAPILAGQLHFESRFQVATHIYFTMWVKLACLVCLVHVAALQAWPFSIDGFFPACPRKRV